MVVNGVKSDSATILSGVPKELCLDMFFSLYINDITEGIDSELRLFADNCLCIEKITDNKETLTLQEDTDHLECWARSWGMRFQPVKCSIMQITRKQIKKINTSYNLEGTILNNVEKIKYLGITIHKDLKLNACVSNICTKANRTLGFFSLGACPQDVKDSAYKEGTGASSPGIW